MAVVLLSTILAVAAAPAGAQALTCNGLAATLTGTEGDDRLVGTAGDDVIVALGGNDLVIGGDGDDTICLGAGNDRAIGQKGEDAIFGENGNDLITGGNRGDLIDGGPGNDTIRGNNGIDTLIGGLGDDLVIGGRNNDTISGNEGNDELRGGSALDDISGGAGDDLILGGRGRDVIDGDDGFDLLDGGLGDDQIFARDDFGDVIDERDGNDSCILDPFDLAIGCEGGDIRASASGEGSGLATFDPQVIAPLALDTSFAGGPYYVLQYAAVANPGQQVDIVVSDSNGVPIEGILIPAGLEATSGNVIIQGTPAQATITGASQWHVGIIDPAVLVTPFEVVTADRSVVFSIEQAGTGAGAEITFTNPTEVESFAVVVILGDTGVDFGIPITVAPGQSESIAGTTTPGTQVLGIFAPGLVWEFTDFR